LPIRARLTVFFSLLMALVLAGSGLILYLKIQQGFDLSIEQALRSRVNRVLRDLRARPGFEGPGSAALPLGEPLIQTLSPGGSITRSSDGLARLPLLSSAARESLAAPRYYERVVTVYGKQVTARLLAVPSDTGSIAVGVQPLGQRRRALSRLAFLLWTVGPSILALTSGAGWLLAGAALRPVEAMRAAAAAIPADGRGKRLLVPETKDEIARLGDTLNAMLDRLEEGRERERRFVDDASHELRTPLAILRTELEVALRGSRSRAELEIALRSALVESDNLNRLAEDLLVLARSDRGRLTITRSPIDLVALVGRITDSFAARAESSKLTFERRVANGTEVLLDELRITQALGNLIDNAMRHTPEGGTLTIEASSEDGSALISVADTGEGFPVSLLPRAFDPFSRPDDDRSGQSGGAGLGLAIVRAIAEAHGGKVEACNRPQGGALVRLQLPH